MRSETVSSPSERLDRLARRLYGSERGGTAEALLDANPGSADQATAIAGGTPIAAPEVEPEAAAAPVRPWD